MANLGLVLLVFAFVCAVLAAGWQSTYGRVNLLAAAIAFWIAAELFGGITHALH